MTLYNLLSNKVVTVFNVRPHFTATVCTTSSLTDPTSLPLCVLRVYEFTHRPPLHCRSVYYQFTHRPHFTAAVCIIISLQTMLYKTSSSHAVSAR